MSAGYPHFDCTSMSQLSSTLSARTKNINNLLLYLLFIKHGDYNCFEVK